MVKLQHILLTALNVSSALGASFINVTSGPFQGASDSCMTALNSEIDCHRDLIFSKSGYYTDFSSSQLDQICTKGCFNDLNSHRKSVTNECADAKWFDQLTKTYYHPTIFIDQLIYAYNITCLSDTDSGQYCTTYYDLIRNGTQQPSACAPCELQMLQFQLSSPLGTANDDTRSYFKSMTSSCSASGYHTGTPTPVIISSIPSPTADCTGSKYTVQSGDTMKSVSDSQKISFYNLQQWNGLSSNSSSFPTSGELCIQYTCDLYTIKTNETCEDIIDATGLLFSQLLAWNLNFNPLCNNLASMVGDNICISNPAGNYTIVSNDTSATATYTTAVPIPTPTGHNTTSYCGRYYQVSNGDTVSSITEKFNIDEEDFLFLNPEINSNGTNLLLNYYYCVEPVGSISTYTSYPSQTSTSTFVPTDSTPIPWTNITSNYTSNEPFIPLADGTRSDCDYYVWLPADVNSTVLNCWDFAMFFDVSAEEFIIWNPSLEEPTTSSNTASSTITKTATTTAYDYPCTLSRRESYCVSLTSDVATTSTSTAPPSPRASGETDKCTFWYQVASYDTCQGIIALFDLTFAEFYKWNPSIESDCSALAVGTYYCISIWADQYPSDTSLATTTTTKTGNGVSTPTPTQTGMVGDCNDFYKVAQGDTCIKITNKHNISLDKFYNWNPAVKNDCSGLEAGVYVCIGVKHSTTTTTKTKTTKTKTSTHTGVTTPTPIQTGMTSKCNKFYDVKSGDTCAKVANKHNISLDKFYDWNPAVKRDCSDLELHVYVCVGVNG